MNFLDELAIILWLVITPLYSAISMANLDNIPFKELPWYFKPGVILFFILCGGVTTFLAYVMIIHPILHFFE